MPQTERIITIVASTALRVGAFVFLRWIPSHLLPSILTGVSLVYVVSFLNCFQSTRPYKILADDVDIVTVPIEKDDVDAAAAVQAASNVFADNPTVDAAGAGVKELEVKELEVKETVVLEVKEAEVFKTLVTGLPSPGSVFWSLVTFLSNVSLIVMVLDLTYHAAIFYPSHDLSFVRLGYVSANSASFLVREPDFDQAAGLEFLHRPVDTAISLDIGYRAQGAEWTSSTAFHESSSESNDFTASIKIQGLAADTRYEWMTSNGHQGHFVTAPQTGEVSQRVEADGKFSFIYSSCLLPHFPYNIFHHPLAIPRLHHLSELLGILRPAFILFLGDFIYADLPTRHGRNADTYRREYRQVYASPDWPSVSSTRGSPSVSERDYDVPWIHVWDDHEISNDWNQNTTGLFSAAFDPYLHYHLSANPPAYPRSSTESPGAESGLYSAFDQGLASFFIADARMYRTPSSLANAWDPGASILGPTQLADLLDWIARPLPRGVHWKVFVTSVPLTKNWRVNSADTWSGYLHERQKILEAMWTFSAAHPDASIVVLSGDRHEFAATMFPPPGTLPRAARSAGHTSAAAPDGSPGRLGSAPRWPLSAAVHEFSVSPLSQFYLPVRTYRQLDNADICLKYLPEGNSKFGAIEITPARSGVASRLTYRLFVDGRERWGYVLTAGGMVPGREIQL